MDFASSADIKVMMDQLSKEQKMTNNFVGKLKATAKN